MQTSSLRIRDLGVAEHQIVQKPRFEPELRDYGPIVLAEEAVGSLVSLNEARTAK